ncbi:hypothetical protein M0R04_05060 [Candidatus Dojkabacteria bacterium]|jgi:hypothetical protein|nr:hypothetical protein [Candidatus Dojkabacteria bacterium]
MISVIIPTMWKFQPFINYLSDLIDHPLVGEIIIIDNNEKEKPVSRLLENSKVKIHSLGKNIFVNPAWDLGVNKAQFDKICVMNDDMIIDTRIFNRVYNYITPQFGLIGLSVNPVTNHFVDGMIRLKEFQPGDNTFGCFMCFFMHRDNWIPIDSGLELFFGDNWIFDHCLWLRRQILLVQDVFYHSPYGVTCKTLGSLVHEKFVKEKEIYRDIIIANGHIPANWCPEHFRE